MNLSDYFGVDGKLVGNTKNNSESNIESKKNQKNISHKLFTNKLNKLVNSNLIDIIDYTFLLNFLKTKGTIVDAQRYQQIMNKINSDNNIPDEDKTEINSACQCLFKHLHDLFDSDVKDLENIKIDNFIKEIENYNKGNFIFTQDQKNAIRNLCYFLYDSNMRTFGLYGYAGTGKTTTITKFIHYLLNKNYVNSVVFSSPTNKAVNVIKSKFRSDLDELIKNKFKINIEKL